MAEKIRREDEMKLPEFKSVGDAFTYFRELWGKDFSFVCSEEIGEMDCWICHLILDRLTYTREMRELRQGTCRMRSEDFEQSFQVFKIFEDGHVNVAY